MKASVQLVHNSSSANAVSWSKDNRIAVATDKMVYVMTEHFNSTFKDNCFCQVKAILSNQEYPQEYDVGINKDTFQNLPRPSFLLQKLTLDKTMSPTTAATSQYISFSLVKLSPACDLYNRSVLAYLTLDHRLQICLIEDKDQHITEVLNLSSKLHEYAKQRCFRITGDPSEAPPTSEFGSVADAFQEYKSRLYQLAAVGIQWSDVFRVPVSQSESRSSAECSKRQRLDLQLGGMDEFVVLASAMKSGHIVLWRIECPVTPQSEAVVAAVFDSGHEWAAVTSWHHPQRVDDCKDNKALIATGGPEGQISVWLLTAEDTNVEISKMVDVWTEKDGIPVDGIIWLTSQCTGQSFSLIAAKGLFMLAFKLQMENGNVRVVHQSHVASLHSAQISGMDSFGDTVYSASTDSSIQEAVISQNDGISLELKLLQPASNFVGRVDGLAVSKNGVYLAVAMKHTSVHLHKSTSKLNFLIISSAEENERKLLETSGSLCDKLDCLDWLYHQLTQDGAPQGLAHTILADALLIGRSRTDTNYLLKLRIFVLKMLVQKLAVWCYETIKENEKVIQEESLRKRKESLDRDVKTLLRLHIEDCLQRWKASQESTSDVTGRTKTTLNLMVDWLKNHSTCATEPPTSLVAGVIEDAQFEERCRLCGEIILLTSQEKDSCPNGHSWSRCCSTFLLCQTLKPRRCAVCGTPSVGTDNTDSIWLSELLQFNCIYCDGPFTQT